MGLFNLLSNIISIPVKIIETGIKVVDKAATIADEGIVKPVKDVIDKVLDGK